MPNTNNLVSNFSNTIVHSALNQESFINGTGNDILLDTIKFTHDLSDTESNTTILEEDVSKFESNIKKINNDLAVSKTLNTKLHQLNNSLKTASNLLSIVRIIPEISTAASRTKEVIDTFQKPIGKATSASDKIEKVITPVRNSLESIEHQTQHMDEALLNVLNVENSMIATIGEAQNCITALPNGDIKNTLITQLDKVSATLDPPVLIFDDVQIKAIHEINDIHDNVDTVLSWSYKFDEVSLAIDSVINTLKPLISALQAIANVFNQTIRIPYGGYPKICHKHVLGVSIPYPCGWHTVYFSFSIKQILNGINGVLAPVVKLLDQAMNAILNPLLNALNLNIHLPNIPGLDIVNTIANELDGTIKKIENEFNNVYSIFDKVNEICAEIESYVDEVQHIYKECHITGKS